MCNILLIFNMRKVELLAPARTADIGIEAFRHGADAVYIGAPAFSARAAAGNSVEDIERLAAFGHQFGAKTIIAFNTILTDSELQQARRLAWQLYDAGADALIIQDYGLLQLDLPPIELHASTQTDNRTAEKVRLLHDLGLTRVVLARELSIDQIRAIHEAVPEVELECFVHGALCVCVSGQCYLSSALTGRSANRGECAQPCRLPMDLYSQDGTQLLARQRHLLSLRDMNRSAYIEQLLDAGVTSLKIEGRLKDMAYVKNVVAYYRQCIDRVLERRPEFSHVSSGRVTYTFEPCAEKSFSRGFTSYFAEGEREPMWNFDSPKSIGEQVGQVVRVGRDSFAYSGTALHNGDGLVIDGVGFRLNRFDPDRQLCYPLDGQKVCAQLRPGQRVFRNLDVEFEKLLAKPSATRVIAVEMDYDAAPDHLHLHLRSEDGVEAEAVLEGQYACAEKPQTANIQTRLTKLGDTVLRALRVTIADNHLFVPSSHLAELRRLGVRHLLEEREKMQTQVRKSFCAHDYAKCAESLSATGILPEGYLTNVLNGEARAMLQKMGVQNIADAFETQQTKEGIVMQTRHCLKYAFGQCPRYPNHAPERLLAPGVKIGSGLVLKIGNRKFFLKFGCKNDCYSKIFTIFAPFLDKTQ